MKKTAQSGSDREGETDMTRKEIRKKGFTLMELLAVVAIIGILSALIAVGVIAYNRSLKVMELNNTAEEIYIAAQNHLTALRTNATANDALKNAGYGTKASDISGKPADMTSGSGSQWEAIYAFGTPSASAGISNGTNASGGTNTSGTTTAGNNASAGLSGNTGSATTSGTTASSGSANTAGYAQVAAYILPAGAVDGTVAGGSGSYIIEYNPKAYTVYGVFYADGKSSVLGRDTGETISVTDDLASLNAEVKADGKTKITSYKPKNSSGSTGICVGYYGGSGVANLKSSTLTGSISVKLVNAEKLYAEITTKKLSVSGAGAATQADKNIRLWLTVTGKTSGAIKTYGCTINASGDEGSIDDAWKEQGEIQKSGSGSDMSITRQVVLDDITTAGWHFAEIFGSGKSDNGVNFIPGEDITVSASAAVTDTLSNIVYSNGTQSTNSLFASLQSSSNGTSTASGASGSTSGGNAAGKITETVTIANFRHLENLSPNVSHVLGMTSADDTDNAVSLTQSAEKTGNDKNAYSSGKYEFHAILGNDLTSVSKDTKSDSDSRSWQGFLEKIQSLNGKDSSAIGGKVSVYYCENKQSSGTTTSTQNAPRTEAGSFAPVRNDYLSGFDGLNHTIEGVLISSDESSSGSRGLFSIVSPVQNCELKNVTLKNFDITAASTSDGNEVENYNIVPSKINKIIPAGSLAGVIAPQNDASVKVTGVTVLEDNSNTCGVWGDSGTAESATVCGGLIGEIYSKDGASVSVDKCSSSVYVQSAVNGTALKFSKMDVAGGLIGEIANVGEIAKVDESKDDLKATITVSNSYAGGHTSNALTAPYYGKKIKTRGNDDAGWNVMAGNSAGGLVGSIYITGSANKNVTLDNVYSTASAACVDGNGKAIDGSDAGGLIGYISNHIFNHPKRLKIKDSYCTGLLEAKYKGGIVGYIALAGEDVSIAQPLSDTEVNAQLLNIFSKCRWLKGVNEDELPCATVLTQQLENSHTLAYPKIAQEPSKKDQDKTQKDASEAGQTDKEATVNKDDEDDNSAMAQKSVSVFRKAENREGTATPYDTQNLNTTYDYKLVTGHHYGDWPKIPQTKINRNGNRLMIDVDTTSDIVTIRLTGLQSREHIYIVLLNPTSELHVEKSGNRSGVYVVKNLEDFFIYNEDEKSENFGKFEGFRPNGDIDAIDYQARLDVTPTGDNKHYSLMLDNISGNMQDNFVDFCNKTNAGFYYGEYLNIRISDQYNKADDPRSKSSCIADYVVNSLFEDVFDPAVLTESEVTAANGTVNLESRAVKDSIKKLTFNGGEGLPNDIGSGEFQPRETSNKQYVAIIKNARHLENLRSNLSNVNTNDKFTVINAIQGCDIIWDGETAGNISNSNHEYDAYVDELSKQNKAHGGSDISIREKIHISNRCFLSVSITDDNELTSYNGNGNSIYGLNLAANNMDPGQAGLFSVISGSSKDFQISHLHLLNTKCEAGKGSATLYTFGTIVGECARNLTLNDVKIEQTDEFKIEAQQYCGGLVGISNGKLKVSGCKIVAPSVSISAGYDVGGLVGQVNDQNSAIIDKCHITASSTLSIKTNLQGQGNIGGFIGNAATTEVSVTDSDLESPSVTISGSSQDSGPCGGLVGSCNSGEISNCHISGIDSTINNVIVTIKSTCPNTNQTGGLIGRVSAGDFTMTNSWLGADLATVSNLGSTAPAGGLIGEVSSTDFKLENSYVCGAYARVMSGGSNQGSVGGLIGEIKTNQGSCSISNDYFSGYVYGPQAQYAGGLIGWIEAGNSENNYASITNCYVSGRTYNGKFPQNSDYLLSLANNDSGYNRFSMPEDQGQLHSNPIDGVIGFGTVGGLIGRYESGYLKISYSFTTTSVASLYSYQYEGGCAGGLIGSTAGTLELDNSYAVSTVEPNGSKFVALGSFIAKDDVDKTKINESCYVIKELNSEPVQPVGQPDNQLNITNLSVSDPNFGNLLRNVQTTNNTETVFRDDFLKTSCPNGYPYLIWTTTTSTGNNHFDGCWVNLNSVKLTIKLSDQDVYLTVNDTHTIVATIEPQGESTGTVEWVSPDKNIVTVNENGEVTGVAPGDATITASIGNSSSATCTVHVAGIKKNDDTFVTNEPVSLTPDTSVKLSMAEIPDDATVTWTVDDKADWLELVDGNTKTVTVKIGESAKAGQETQITATATFNNITVTAKVMVTVMVTDSGSTDNPAEKQDGGESIKSSSPDS